MCLIEEINELRKDQAVREALLYPNFRRRIEAGLASQSQLDLIRMVLESYMRDIIKYLQRLSSTVPTYRKYIGELSYPVVEADAVNRFRRNVKEKLQLIRFIVRLRAESVEARIWKYLEE
ncbi:hypothetical protein BJ508DRAFT_116710 [Ascobolus immersus RN42]|uniref:Uncharacterized protein n=1 Tax=Ascobolus immersus RN42 TaxID=1160509 RepID=A0A3N4I4T8_ASCIM|nr:hypothetical protein BJ508DRAFT_116710 [Ascobolus immersus RN42]